MRRSYARNHRRRRGECTRETLRTPAKNPVLSRGQLAVESSTRQVEFAADHYLYRMSGNAHAASQYPASASSATQHTSHPQARALPPPATHCPHHYQKVAECGRVQANRIPEHTQESRGTGAAATPRCSTHSPVTSHGSRKRALPHTRNATQARPPNPPEPSSCHKTRAARNHRARSAHTRA